MVRPFYASTDLKAFPDLKAYAPDAFEAYNAWSAAAFAEGALSKRAKELIAFAVAHAIQCPYCIELHSNKAREIGASEPEIGRASCRERVCNDV